MLTEKTGNMQMNSKLKSNVISNKAEVAVAASAVWGGGYWSSAEGGGFSGNFNGNEGEFSDFFESLFGQRREAAEEVRLDSKGRTSMPNCIFLYAMPQRPTNKSWKSTVKRSGSPCRRE